MRLVYHCLFVTRPTGDAVLTPDKPHSAQPDRIVELQRQLEDLQRRFPAHSLSPLLMQQLDELEEAIREEMARREQEKETPPNGCS